MALPAGVSSSPGVECGADFADGWGLAPDRRVLLRDGPRPSWDWIQLACDLLGHGRAEGHADGGEAAAREAYERDETDEFTTPMLVGEEARIRPGDSVIAFNFRSDRMREITRALAEPGFDEIDRGGAEPIERYATMTEGVVLRVEGPGGPGDSRVVCALKGPGPRGPDWGGRVARPPPQWFAGVCFALEDDASARLSTTDIAGGADMADGIRWVGRRAPGRLNRPRPRGPANCSPLAQAITAERGGRSKARIAAALSDLRQRAGKDLTRGDLDFILRTTVHPTRYEGVRFRYGTNSLGAGA